MFSLISIRATLLHDSSLYKLHCGFCKHFETKMWREVQLGSQELFITAALVERVPTGLYAKEDPVKKFANGL